MRTILAFVISLMFAGLSFAQERVAISKVDDLQWLLANVNDIGLTITETWDPPKREVNTVRHVKKYRRIDCDVQKFPEGLFTKHKVGFMFVQLHVLAPDFVAVKGWVTRQMMLEKRELEISGLFATGVHKDGEVLDLGAPLLMGPLEPGKFEERYDEQVADAKQFVGYIDITIASCAAEWREKLRR